MGVLELVRQRPVARLRTIARAVAALFTCAAEIPRAGSAVRRLWPSLPLLVLLASTGADAQPHTGPIATRADNTQTDAGTSVLVVHSYSRALAWTEAMDDAIQDTLRSSGQAMEVLTEYLDTKRHPLADIEPALVRLLELKYRDIEPALVITTDNSAFDFVVRHRGIFNDAPLVFAGLNNFDAAWAPPGSNITGVVEKVDLKGTIALIRDLQPDLTTLAVVTDEVPTGKLHREAAIKLFDANDPVISDLILRDLSGITADELKSELELLDPDSAVLHMSLYRDTAGLTFTAEEGIEFVLAHTDRPVYVLWDFMVIGGVVGGHVISGAEQGRVAAALALDLLAGAAPDEIPVRTRSPNESLINWPAVEKFHLELSAIDDTTRILNHPTTFYERHRLSIALTSAALLLLLVTVITGSIVIRRMRITNQHLLASRARIREQNANLARLNADLSDFAFSASHDLKSPVVNALGSIDLAIVHIRKGEYEKACDMLGRAVQGCDRIVTRAEALLRFATGNAGAISPEPVNFPSLVAQTWEAIAAPSTIVLSEDHRDDGEVFVVRSALSLILENLLSNAVKHRDPMQKHGNVQVRSWRGGDRFVFTVQDDGIGIPSDRHADVGRPFRHFGSAVSDGSGLGLMLVRHYVSRIGGCLTFTSEPGHGTTFIIGMPHAAGARPPGAGPVADIDVAKHTGWLSRRNRWHLAQHP